MTEQEVLAYVRASAALQGLRMDEARAQRVAGHLARAGQLAQLLDSAVLLPEDELAEIFQPAPFPGTKPEGGQL
jgi:hypothetical protein